MNSKQCFDLQTVFLGLPLVIMIAWTLLRIFFYTQEEDPGTSTEVVIHAGHILINLFTCQAMRLVLSCPFLEERDTDFFVYKLPVFILLLVNTVFLLWIMMVQKS